MIKLKDLLWETGEYRGSHKAPDKTYAPLHDMTQVYPDDIYSNEAPRYYGHNGGDINDKEMINTIRYYRNKPNVMVRIYRAIPNFNKELETKLKYRKKLLDYVSTYGFPPMKDVTARDEFIKLGRNKGNYIEKLLNDVNSLQTELKESKFKIDAGDWVTLSKDYAALHGESTLRGDYKILTKKVPARTLFTDGNSIFEFGYDPT